MQAKNRREFPSGVRKPRGEMTAMTLLEVLCGSTLRRLKELKRGRFLELPTLQMTTYKLVDSDVLQKRPFFSAFSLIWACISFSRCGSYAAGRVDFKETPSTERIGHSGTGPERPQLQGSFSFFWVPKKWAFFCRICGDFSIPRLLCIVETLVCTKMVCIYIGRTIDIYCYSRDSFVLR